MVLREDKLCNGTLQLSLDFFGKTVTTEYYFTVLHVYCVRKKKPEVMRDNVVSSRKKIFGGLAPHHLGGNNGK